MMQCGRQLRFMNLGCGDGTLNARLAGLEGDEDAFLAFNAGFGKFDLHAERHERGEDTLTH